MSNDPLLALVREVTGWGAIFDEFRDGRDAIQQMATHIRMLQDEARQNAPQAATAPVEDAGHTPGTPDAAAGNLARSTGHWTATEEAQARYLVAAMTGRMVEEVTEPLSRLLHGLRYVSRAPEVAKAIESEDEFEAERAAVQASYGRLTRMERRAGDARRMLLESFETAGTSLGDTATGRRMFRHVCHIKNLP